MCMCGYSESYKKCLTYAFVENVVTHAAYRKKGYTTDCLNYAKKIVDKCNCYRCCLQVQRKRVH